MIGVYDLRSTIYGFFTMKKLSDYITGVKNEPGRVIPFGVLPHSCKNCRLREKPVLDEFGVLQEVWVCSIYPESECSPDFSCVSYVAPFFEKK